MAGVYVHIPFCKQRCIYCDFYSTTAHEWKNDYVSAVLNEAAHRRGELSHASVSTLYVGGGTPSQLSGAHFARLIAGLRRILGLDKLEEFTVEVNPDDITPDYVRLLCDAGAGRVSMGVQSFDDGQLRFLRRRHDARLAMEAVRRLRDGGFANISIDLMYGLPGQTLRSWRLSLDRAVSLDVEHISAYCLSYECGTPLWELRERGTVHEAGDELCVAMYETLVERLSLAGYEHYEISNFCLPGYRSRHNSSYWDGTPYLGLGAAAHSYDGEVRRCNPADLQTYLHGIDTQGRAFVEERLSATERYNELVMLALRTSRGLCMPDVRSRFGAARFEHLRRQAEPHIAAGALAIDDGFLRLTRSGVMVSDAVIADLFAG